VKKGQNFNHPSKGRRIKVAPIRQVEILAAIKKSLANNPRNLALFTLGINTHLRPMDLLGIKVRQVLGLKDTDEIDIKERRTGKTIRIALNEACVESINKLLLAETAREKGKLNPDGFLFKGRQGPLLLPSMNNLVKKWCTEINLPGNYGSHTLRKTFGYQHIVNSGAELTEIMELFNHATPYQTMDYLSIDPEDLNQFRTQGPVNDNKTFSSLWEGKLKKLEAENEKLKQEVAQLKEREEQLNIIIENAKDAIVLTDEKGYFLDATESSMAFSGLTRDELKGKHFSEVGFMNAETVQKCIELLNESVMGKPGRRVELEATRKDGTALVIEANPKMIKRDGKMTGFLAIIRDITERRSAEEVLQESEEMARALLNATTDAVMLLDVKGRVLDMNKAYADVFQLRKDEMIGKCLWHLLPEDLISFIQETTARVFSSGRSVRIEKESMGAWYDNVVYPVFDMHGHVSRVAIFSHDITRLKQAEEALLRHRDHLEELVKERTANLEESNTALKVLLKKGDEVKKEIQDKILFNIKELVSPYLEKMKKSRLDDRQRTYVDIIESNLDNIISPFIRGLSTRYLKITPTEIQVANLIRQGKTSKEIAEILNMSTRTIDTHRYNIRKKIGLKNKKANLTTYLLSSN